MVALRALDANHKIKNLAPLSQRVPQWGVARPMNPRSGYPLSDSLETRYLPPRAVGKIGESRRRGQLPNPQYRQGDELGRGEKEGELPEGPAWCVPPPPPMLMARARFRKIAGWTTTSQVYCASKKRGQTSGKDNGKTLKARAAWGLRLDGGLGIMVLATV